MQKQKLLLLLIFLTSFSIRFYKLGQIPNGLSVDEADMGYNAYSILQTGKDVYNNKFPLFFQSLDDYKPGFAIYSIVPAIKLLGLNDMSIRLVPAILGSFTPILAFFIFKQAAPRQKLLASSAAILFTFAPWSIHISRTTFMYIDLIFFYLLFFLMFLLSLKRKLFLPISFVILGFTLYIYYAAVIYLPFILLILTVAYFKEIASSKRIFITAVILLSLTITPALMHYASPISKNRLNDISQLSPDIALPTSIKERQFDQKNAIPFAGIIHNRRFVYISSLLENYFDYFNFDYLFVNSKNVRYFYTNSVGLFYLIELPFFLIGIYYLVKIRSKISFLLLSLLVVSPIPASITLGSPFPHRSLLLLLVIELVTVFGIYSFTQIVKRNDLKVVVIFLYCLSVGFFSHQYFIHSPKEFFSENNNGAWFSSPKAALPKIDNLKNNYDKVIFTWSQGKLVPPVYYLFYEKTNPRKVQQIASTYPRGTSFKIIYRNIDNVEFRAISEKQDHELKKTLFVIYPEEAKKLKSRAVDFVYLQDGELHFVIAENP